MDKSMNSKMPHLACAPTTSLNFSNFVYYYIYTEIVNFATECCIALGSFQNSLEY